MDPGQAGQQHGEAGSRPAGSCAGHQAVRPWRSLEVLDATRAQQQSITNQQILKEFTKSSILIPNLRHCPACCSFHQIRVLTGRQGESFQLVNTLELCSSASSYLQRRDCEACSWCLGLHVVAEEVILLSMGQVSDTHSQSSAVGP